MINQAAESGARLLKMVGCLLDASPKVVGHCKLPDASVDAEAILVTDTDSYAIDLIDISQSGAGFRTTMSLEAGALVYILLPNDERRRSALVRWARGRHGGLWFTKPLDPVHLESIPQFQNRISM